LLGGLGIGCYGRKIHVKFGPVGGQDFRGNADDILPPKAIPNGVRMIDLDDLTLLRRADPGGMATRIAELPEAVSQAWHQAQEFPLPNDFKSAKAVLITGMGGSAIGGDLVRSLAESEAPVPVVVQRGYDLPAFAGPDTLVIAVSHSGATEETLSQVDAAIDRGCRVLAITSGGVLRTHKRLCVFGFDYPAQPRAAIAYLFIPLVSFFGQLAWLRDRSGEIDEAVRLLHELQPLWGPERPLVENPSKQLARSLHDRIPFIYGGGVMAEVAHRWKTQLNENSKAWSAYDTFPELNHNAVVGYERPSDFPSHAFVVLLQTTHEHPRVVLRERVTQGILEKRGVNFQTIPPRGEGALAQMLASILLGDYASYYLAHLYEVDPTPVVMIDHLKQELARAAA
jgi:glucose/mannose-6-phosphate isomerase